MSWNTCQLLEACLAALPEATAGLRTEVVVVDNASRDGSADAAGRFTGVHVARNGHNAGYAVAMNQALTTDLGAGVPDVLIALNPDTVPNPGSLTYLAQRLMDEPDVGMVVPRLFNSDGSPQHSAYRFPSARLAAVVALTPMRFQRGTLASRWWLEGTAGHDRPVDIDWAIGAVHVLRSEAVGADAPYNERWFMYVEDLDLCWRLQEGGWRRRLEPAAAVMHVGNAAGEQAWGRSRTAKWLAASYDWYRLRRGLVPMWTWGLLNLCGSTLHLLGAVTYRLISRKWPGSVSRDEIVAAPSVHLRCMAAASRNRAHG